MHAVYVHPRYTPSRRYDAVVRSQVAMWQDWCGVGLIDIWLSLNQVNNHVQRPFWLVVWAQMTRSTNDSVREVPNLRLVRKKSVN